MHKILNNIIYNKYIYIILLITSLFIFMGCTGGTRLAGIEKAKIADDVKVNPDLQLGVGNSNQETETNTDVGRDMNTGSVVGGNMSNDSEMIKKLSEDNRKLYQQVIETQKELYKMHMDFLYDLLKYILGFLFGLILKYELQIRNINKKLIKMIEDNEKVEDRMLERLLKMQEVKK